MDFIIFFLLSISLSFDTFAVSVSSSLAIKEANLINILKISFTLGLFQGLMLLLGWLAGNSIKTYIIQTDHWIAFGLLFILGIKMILEGLKKDDNKKKNFNPLNLFVLLSISIATSIDALAAGISYAFLGENILIASLILTLITIIVSILGILTGKNVGLLLGKRLEIIGGIILILIGTKILIEHTLL